jgi:alpha-glucosidase
VIGVASGPGSLIESDILLNLNDPNRLADTDWIEPGVATWDWRVRGATTDDGFTYGLDMESLRRLIDFAGEHDFPYALIDGGWYGHEGEGDPTTAIDRLDVPELVEYAAERGVDIVLYVTSEPLRREGPETVLETYADWGVAGIKHGFLDENDQDAVRFVHELLELTAEYEMVYDVHEGYQPTGVRRTYPHFLTREYSRTLGDGEPGRFIEPDTASAERFASPAYHATLPFLQNALGPLDASPGLFDLETEGERKNIPARIPSTLAAQLARCVIISTGLLTLPDHPEAYRERAELFQFVDDLPRPLTWDETRVLDAAIGDRVAIARRRGDTWYLGAQTDEEARTMEIECSFLESGRDYTARIYADGEDAHYVEDPTAATVSESSVSEGTTLSVELAPGGGLAATFRPAGE